MCECVSFYSHGYMFAHFLGKDNVGGQEPVQRCVGGGGIGMAFPVV